MCKVNNKLGDFTKSTWVADTGATSTIITDDSGLVDSTQVNEAIEVGGKNEVRVTKKGTWKGFVRQKNGDSQYITIENVKYCPKFGTNILSITSCIGKGWSIGNNEKLMHIEKEGVKIIFDRIMESEDGYITGVEMESKKLTTKKIQDQAFDVNAFHKLMGHTNEEDLKKRRNTAM